MDFFQIQLNASFLEEEQQTNQIHIETDKELNRIKSRNYQEYTKGKTRCIYCQNDDIVIDFDTFYHKKNKVLNFFEEVAAKVMHLSCKKFVYRCSLCNEVMDYEYIQTIQNDFKDMKDSKANRTSRATSKQPSKGVSKAHSLGGK